jgi:hypothetical protein
LLVLKVEDPVVMVPKRQPLSEQFQPRHYSFMLAVKDPLVMVLLVVITVVELQALVTTMKAPEVERQISELAHC